MHRIYLQLSLKDIDLGFAGRYPESSPVHRALAVLQPGAPLQLQHTGTKWELTNLQGQTVCRLAKAFSPQAGKQFVSATVLAVIVRFREDSEPEFQELIKTDSWEVVIPELIFC